MEVLLEIRDTGFKITSPNLGAVWSLYEALQHYVKEFTKNENEPVNACELRQELAIMEVSFKGYQLLILGPGDATQEEPRPTGSKGPLGYLCLPTKLQSL